MTVTIRIVLFLLFVTAVNCQLALLWLNYQHFQCTQDTRNYHESVRHQYLCTSSLIRTCISDVNIYSHNLVIFLDNFCGFIDGRNLVQPHTIWIIHVKPNIKIHFLKFLLFDNNWYCDYEYLRLKSNNKSSTFCGNRFPWVYDASDTRVEIVLMKQPRAGTEPWLWRELQLELLYYGAYDQPNSHFVMLTKPSSIINTHFPNTEQNIYETFHFISSSRLDILYLTAINVRSKDQVVCFDGPGIKSPVLQFTNNQSDWKCLSSTFQMMCKFSKANNVSTTVPHLQYQSMRARDYQVKHLTPDISERQDISLEIITSDSKRTIKYMYIYIQAYLPSKYMPSLSYFRLEIDNIDFGRPYLAYPYLLSEGNSCMYGGIYIVQTVLSKDFEILSYCHHYPLTVSPNIIVDDLHNVSIVIIHYSEYSTEIFFHAVIRCNDVHCHYPEIKQMTPQEVDYKEDTISFTLPVTKKDNLIQILSIQLSFRKMKYINISFHETKTCLKIRFRHSSTTSCVNIAISYHHRVSNIQGKTNNQVTTYLDYSGVFEQTDYFQSMFINMSECNLFDNTEWVLQFVSPLETYNYFSEVNTTRKYNLPDISLFTKQSINDLHLHPFWILCHLAKPQDASPHAIWSVQIQISDIVSHVSLEVLKDDYQSSSVYGWNHFNSSYDVYIIIDKAINILFQANNPAAHEIYSNVFTLLLRRHFTYDDQITKHIGGKTPQQSQFTFHNQR